MKASTAMVKGSDEIPITYLNKNHPYQITIIDTQSQLSPRAKYRTAIRVSFEDDQQRARPAASWQLWKEGRGTNEAHKKGGKIQAIEYVVPDQSAVSTARPNVQLVNEDFDGFSVIWIPNSTGAAECSVSAKFSFLSTDFSHSKGVKGVPVRLCAKTEVIGGGDQVPPSVPNREICYCCVKTFRDHGSERKIHNDKEHIKKLIQKIQTQMNHPESVKNDNGKRRRSDSTVVSGPTSKNPRINRRTPVSSDNELDPDDEDDDLQAKLRKLNTSLTSMRPISIFNLKGEERDDLDMHPIPLFARSSDSALLEDAEIKPLKRESTQASTQSSSLTASTTQTCSPTMVRKLDAGGQCPTPIETMSMSGNGGTEDNYRLFQQANAHMNNPQHLVSPPELTRVARVDAGEGESMKWLGAVDVDDTYEAPPERIDKPGKRLPPPKFLSKDLMNSKWRVST